MKWVMYVLIAVLCLVLREQGFEHLKIFGVAPMFGGALTACVAMREGTLRGGLYGLFCGYLYFGLTGGVEHLYALIYLLGGAACGAACAYLFRKRFLTALLWSLVINAVASFLVFVMFYYIPGRADVSALLRVALPEIVYSTAVTALVYPAAAFVHKGTREAEV